MTARRGSALLMLVSVLLFAESAPAQPAQVDRQVPVAEWLRELLETPPGPPREVLPPSDANFRQEPARAPHPPAFIGPLWFRTATGRAGAAAWIAPNTGTGSRLAGQPEQSGWLGFGFVSEWGGPRAPQDTSVNAP